MRDVPANLANAAHYKNRYPLSRILVEKVKMEKPELFAGSDTDADYHQFDLTELGDGSYFRAHILLDGSYSIRTQRITDPTNTSQWTTWDTVTGSTPTVGSGIALYATGSTIQMYYAVGSELRRRVSLDYGVTWGAEETVVASIESGVACLITAPGSDLCFYTKWYSVGDYGIVAAYKTGGSWETSVLPTRKGWLFLSSVPEWTLSAVPVDDQFLVTWSAAALWPAYWAQLTSVFFRQPDFWSPISQVIPIDTYVGEATYPERCVGTRLSVIGDKIFCCLRRSMAQKSDYTSHAAFGYWVWSLDGKSWSFDDEHSIQSKDRAGSGRKCLVDGSYFYEVGWNEVYRTSATCLVTSVSQLDITDDVVSWNLSKPTGMEAGVAVVNLMNVNGKYNNHSIVKTGSRVIIQGGYRCEADDPTLSEDLYTNLATLSIDSLNTDTERATNQISLLCRDNVKKLKLKASDARIYLSQARFQCDFDEDSDAGLFVSNLGEESSWELDTVEQVFRATNSQQRNVALAGFYEQDALFSYCKLRFTDDITNATGGIVIACQSTDVEEYYSVQYSDVYKKVGLFKSTSDLTGVTLVSGSAKNWVQDTFYWLGVLWHYGIFYVFSSTDGRVFTHEFTYEDRSYIDGYIGLYAFPGVDGEVEFDEFVAVNLDTDNTVEDIMRDAAVRSGVEEFSFAADFEDDCDSIDYTDKWTTNDRIGTWAVVDGAITGDSSDLGIGILLSRLSERSLKVDFKMKLTGLDQHGGVMLRSSAGVGYIVGVEKKADGDYASVLRGPGYNLIRLPIEHTSINLDEFYNYTVSIQGSWVSLWCEDCLLVSYYGTQLTSAGWFGLSVLGLVGTLVHFDDIRISEVDTAAPLWTINPGDPYENTLQALAEIETARYHFDGDGVLVVARNSPSVYSMSFNDEIQRGRVSNSDLDWVSVVRVDGDYCFASYFDDDMINDFGWRFAQYTIRELTEPQACYEAAEAKVMESKRGLYKRDFDAPAQVALEPDDRIRYNNVKDGINGDFLVRSLTFTFQKRPALFNMYCGMEACE